MSQGRYWKNVIFSYCMSTEDIRVKLSVFLKVNVISCRYAMKCLDKKRIKLKQGETLALNERIMLSLVSTGVSQDLAVLNDYMEC